MKQGLLLFIGVVAMFSTGVAYAKECKGVNFLDQAQVDGTTLTLNGLGLRQATVLRVNVYVAALYVAKPSNDPKTILESNTPKELILHFVRNVSASDLETLTPREAVEEKQPTGSSFTIYPVPNYGGDFSSRSYLTGDWDGLRSKLAERGVQFEFNVTQIYQGVVSGGTNRTGRYSGSTDIVLKLDSQKLGLWPGDFCLPKPRCRLATRSILTREAFFP